jgi:exodeoxyribonuclease-3
MSTAELRLLSWNILQGGGSRCTAILEAIADHAPDVVCLQEFRGGDAGERLRAGLTRLGLGHHQVAPTASPRDNGLMIASRWPFEAEPLTPDPGATVHMLATRLRFGGPEGPEPGLPLEELQLVGVRFPQKEAQIPLFQALLHLPPAWREQPALLIGDFNCGIPFEDSETRTFYASPLFQQLLAQGWIDAWRSRHRQAREFTWFSRLGGAGSGGGHGFRYDHALASPALDRCLRRVIYDHDVRLAGHSDHSALVVVIGEASSR